MPDSKVTLLIPLYEKLDGLIETLKNCKNVEIICSDDSDFLSDFSEARRHGAIQVFEGTKTRNAVDNWNFLLSRVDCSSSKRFILMHHDEALVEDVSLDEINSLECNQVGLLNHRNETSKTLNAKTKCLLMNKFPWLIGYVNFLGPIGLLVMPTNEHVFDRTLKWLVDVEFYLKLGREYEFVPLESGVVKTIYNAQSITSNIEHKFILSIKEAKDIGIVLYWFVSPAAKAIYHFIRLIFGKVV